MRISDWSSDVCSSDLLPAQRNVQTHWNDWFVADDVVMIPLDPKVTRVELSDASQPFQVAQGSVVEDSDGRRQVTLLFPTGTTATITRAEDRKSTRLNSSH